MMAHLILSDGANELRQTSPAWQDLAICMLTTSFLNILWLQQPEYDIIAQFIIGYVLPGKPIANLLFKIYGRISTVHALSFLSDLKLGHYMKIPPRCMYTAQVNQRHLCLNHI